MGWFSRTPKEPKPDPIGDICRLMVEKPWEWVASETTERSDSLRTPALVHISGIRVTWNLDAYGDIIGWWSPGEGSRYTKLSPSDAIRVRNAALGHAAAKATKGRMPYDSVAQAMAKAVLAGDRIAARQLADLIMELEGGTLSG